ncbi:MAG TPA: hypothetical protein VFP61_14555 [Acidimicrobiales bacterium]|nr:hypothetical protein [Acidimicrobiales bacterium]
MRITTTRGIASLAAGAAVLMVTSGTAWAAKPTGGGGTTTTTPTGIDASYPQCGSALPTSAAFAVIGVNGGLANDYNNCLSSEWAYAAALTPGTNQAAAQAYLNTGDPGNTVGDWPSPAYLGAAATPSTADPYGPCGYASGSSGPGADDQACAWAYGYDMVDGITAASETIPGDAPTLTAQTGASLSGLPVWLDVETGNSWETGGQGLANNIADLQGMTAALQGAGSAVGVYSTGSQWSTITGTPGSASAGNLWGLPDWIPGARTEKAAQSNCTQAAFTGGTTELTQWTASIDGDVSCIL